MLGKVQPFGDQVPVKEDKVYEKLCQISSIHDIHYMAVFSVILPSLSKYVETKFSAHLAGGKYADITDDLCSITTSVEKHNKFCEQTFAYLNQLLRFKPDIKTQWNLISCLLSTRQGSGF